MLSRIKRNDTSAVVYASTNSIDSEGNLVQSWVEGATIWADWQPINGRTTLQGFGLDLLPADSWIVYADNASQFPVGSVALHDGKYYECRGVAVWYSHAEVVMVPWVGTVA